MALVTAANIATGVAGHVFDKVTGGLLSTVKNAAANGAKISSLADLARPARVEPLMLVEKSLDRQPYMEDIAKFSLTTFCGYYLQALSMIMNVGKIDTLKVFDSLNPERSQGSIKDAVWSTESYSDGLPSMEMFCRPVERGLVASLEAIDPSSLSPEDLARKNDADSRNKTPAGINPDVPQKLFEADNLAVGKLLMVELRDDKQTGKIPVIVRLLPAVVPGQALVHIFTAGGRDNWTERYHLARAGQIRWVRDLMLGMDMVDDHRKALVNDTSGTYEQITSRRRNNARKAALTGQVSMADASNIAIISAQTARELGRSLYGKLDSKAVREKIFDNSYLLLLVVVNEMHERVVVYHRGLDIASEYSFKEIKGSEKNKGPDITEIFKSFHQTLGGSL